MRPRRVAILDGRIIDDDVAGDAPASTAARRGRVDRRLEPAARSSTSPGSARSACAPGGSRTALTALGIAIGIAAMVAVVGISASSRADVLAQLDALGTDLLRVAPGPDGVRRRRRRCRSRPATSADRIGPVTSAAGVTQRRRHRAAQRPRSTTSITGGIAVVAADTGVLDAISGQLAAGRFLDDASSQRADRGARRRRRRRGSASRPSTPAPRVWLGGQWFVVIGILEPAPLAPEIDGAALIGYPVADELFDTTTSPSTLYVRTVPDQVEAVRAVLGPSIRPRGARRGRRVAAVRRPRGPGHHRRRAAQPAARPRRRRPRRRRRRDHQRDGDLGARTAQRDRRAPRPRRPPACTSPPSSSSRPPCWRTLGGIGGAALGSARHRAVRPQPGLARRRPGRRPRRRRRRRPRRRACSPASPPPCAPPASTPPTRSVRTDAGARRAQRATQPCCRRRPARRRGSAAGRGPARSPRRRSA